MSSSPTTLSPEIIDAACAPLEPASAAFARRYRGETGARRPVHTVYGGAHLFRPDLAQKLGAAAIRAFEEHVPDPTSLALALGFSPSLAGAVHERVLQKLHREPVEDLRIDFEDGYGARPDAEEDEHAVTAACALREGMDRGTLPPFIGIRIKSLGAETRRRAVRTLDLFLTALFAYRDHDRDTALPPGFVVTLPKITVAPQVTALASLLDALEAKLGLRADAIGIEVMIETPQIVLGPSGESALPRLLDAARGRCVGAHLGAYDYTAECGITAAHQTLGHPACDLARQMMALAFAGTGVRLSDGGTNVLPIPPHKGSASDLDAAQIARNHETVLAAWKLHHDNIRRALIQGFYQGWDLHPAQLPVRYAATYAFFLEGLDLAQARLGNFVNKAAQATRTGQVFDDAATGQGLLNFFLQAIDAGAITEEEAVQRTRLSLQELRGKSFAKIVEQRRAP
jgi:citrate lyase beta subunit